MFRFIRFCFGSLTSTKVGIGVMAALAVLSLLGATIPQGADYSLYHEVYGDFWGTAIWRSGLSDVFRTDYYTALLVLLCVMVFACSLNRFPRALIRRGEIRFVSDRERLEKMAQSGSANLDVDGEEAELHIIDVLKRRFYRISRRRDNQTRMLYASKMGFSRYGSFILHLSFIFLLAGGIVITRFGSRSYRDINVGGDFTLKVSRGDSVRVVVEDFNVEFNDRNQISDYVCQVSLSGDDGLLGRHRIRPNHPLKYGDKEVYLVSFEENPDVPEGFVVSVYDSAGALILPHMAVPIGYELNVDELGASVEADDGSVPRLRLRSGSGIETYLIRQHRLRKTDDRYQFVMIHAIPTLVVTLEVVREPGQWLIIAGLALLTLGTCVTLYLSHRRIWFIVNPLAEGRADVVFGGGASRNREGFAREFESIRSTLDELA